MGITVPHAQLYTLLKQIHPGHSISTEASAYVRELLEAAGRSIVNAGVTNNASMENELARRKIGRLSFAAKHAEENFVYYGGDRSMLSQPMMPKKGGKRGTSVAMAGLLFDTGGTIAINAFLQDLCLVILLNAGDIVMNMNVNKTNYSLRINLYHVKVAVAWELGDVFESLRVDTKGAKKCMQLPSVSKTRKSPPFDPELCLKAGEVKKRGLDGNMYHAIDRGMNDHVWKKSK